MKPRELWNKVARKLYISLQKEKKPLNFQEVSALQTTWWHKEHLDFPASPAWSYPGQCMNFVPQPALERIIPLDFGEAVDSGLRLYGTSIPPSTIKQDKGWRI